MHTSKVIQKEKARLRKKAGLDVSEEREKDFNRGQRRQAAHKFYQDDGNALQYLTKEKRDWLLKKANLEGGVLLCDAHTGKRRKTPSL